MASQQDLFVRPGELDRETTFAIFVRDLFGGFLLFNSEYMVTEESWRYIKICRQARELTHLFFANDSLLFLWSNNDGVDDLQKVLNMYQMASGKIINVDESSIFSIRGWR